MFRRALTAALVAGLVAWAGAAAQAAAGALWESKPYTSWTSGELKEILASSPWSGRASMTKIRVPAGTSSVVQETALVTWTTAQPMREALVREQIGQNGTISKEVESFLATPPGSYILALRIDGGTTAASFAKDAAAALPHTSLVLSGGRTPIPATKVEAQVLDREGRLLGTPGSVAADGLAAADGSSLFVFVFPRGFGITDADKEIEFVTRLGNYAIKKKFKTREMIYRGQLAI